MTEMTLASEDSLLSASKFEHAFRMAKMVAQSALVPKAYKDKPQDVLVAMEMGRSLGLSPLSAIQNIAVINGKPCLYGDAVLSVCLGHPEFDDIKEEALLDDKGETIGYRCAVKRTGMTPVVRSFTVEDARRAGLWGKEGPWKQYANRMLQMRARGFALRDSFADALGGIRMVEEVNDYTEKKAKKDAKSAFMDDLKAAKGQVYDAGNPSE
jgi:hypothetical protein